MQVKFETIGFDEMLARLEKSAAQLTGSDITGIVSTTVEHAAPVEYGSKQKHTRKRARSKAKQGTFKLPKGGTSVRGKNHTIVTQPARAMVRTSIPTVERQLLENLKNMPALPTDDDLEEAIADATLRAHTEIAERTPVDDGILKGSWKPRVIRGGAD